MSLPSTSRRLPNIQHWRFVLISDPRMREVIWMSSQATDASLFVVICADVRAWKKSPEGYWAKASAGMRTGVVEV